MGFTYSEEELEALLYEMEVDGTHTLRNLSVTPFKAKIYATSYAYFRPRDINSPEDAKQKMETWPKQLREAMQKLSGYLR